MYSTNILLALLIVQSTLLITNGQQNKKFFRKDYTYISATQSFYKIHTIHRTWKEARQKCVMEGASLFYAEDQSEANAVISFWNQTQPFSWVFVGISDLIAKEVFETIDGRPVTDVYNAWGPGEPNNANGIEDCVILRRDGSLNDDNCNNKYPFICKKSLDTLEWHQDCDMPNTGYVYNADLGRCYKFHLDPKNWTDAAAVCSAELSYLAVINSQAEADYLVTLTDQAPKDGVTGDYLRGAVHLGFLNRDGEGWKTVKGTTLENSGYSKWGGGQPDGAGQETCGTMFYNGHLNDLRCERHCFYICEHEIGALSESFDDRFANL